MSAAQTLRPGRLGSLWPKPTLPDSMVCQSVKRVQNSRRCNKREMRGLGKAEKLLGRVEHGGNCMPLQGLGGQGDRAAVRVRSRRERIQVNSAEVQTKIERGVIHETGFLEQETVAGIRRLVDQAAVVEREDALGQGTPSGEEEVDDGAKTWWKQSQGVLDAIPARARGLVMLNLLVLLCGTNWVVVKDAGTAFDPYIFASLRFMVAALMFAPVLMKSASRDEKVLQAGFEIGIYTAIGYLFQSQGLLTTDASRASFLSTFTVLVVPFLAGLSGRGVRPLTWASALAALVGVSMLEQSGSPPSLGDLWSALSAISFGVQMFRTEHWSRILGHRNAFPLMSVVMATTAAISTVAACLTHTTEISTLIHGIVESGPLTLGSYHIPWTEVLYTGILTTDVVLLMEVVALQDVSSMEAAIIYTLEPVIGAGFAFIMLGERWGPMGWAGAGVIVASCFCMQMWGNQEESN